MSSRLECKNLTKDYGNVMALSDVNLTLESGRIVGLLGPNGSGKTTLIKLANGLLQPTSGEILLNGININKYSVKSLRSKIGVVTQKTVLFKGTIRENLLWGNENASDKELYDALESAQALNIISSKENNMNAEVAPRGKNFRRAKTETNNSPSSCKKTANTYIGRQRFRS